MWVKEGWSLWLVRLSEAMSYRARGSIDVSCMSDCLVKSSFRYGQLQTLCLTQPSSEHMQTVKLSTRLLSTPIEICLALKCSMRFCVQLTSPFMQIVSCTWFSLSCNCLLVLYLRLLSIRTGCSWNAACTSGCTRTNWRNTQTVHTGKVREI